MANTLQRPEDAFNYRDAICCATCPACVNGACKRSKMPVDPVKVCDKHPAWKAVIRGHNPGKQGGGNKQ